MSTEFEKAEERKREAALTISVRDTTPSREPGLKMAAGAEPVKVFTVTALAEYLEKKHQDFVISDLIQKDPVKYNIKLSDLNPTEGSITVGSLLGIIDVSATKGRGVFTSKSDEKSDQRLLIEMIVGSSKNFNIKNLIIQVHSATPEARKQLEEIVNEKKYKDLGIKLEFDKKAEEKPEEALLRPAPRK